jgi:surface protein
MNFLFAFCHKLENIIFKFENTENLEEMNYMFNECLILPSLDLSSFNTKNVKSMNSMFTKCNKLVKLNLSFFDTRNCKNNEKELMFSECKELREIIINKSIDPTFIKEELRKANLNENIIKII